jgi:hypothetical protein
LFLTCLLSTRNPLSKRLIGRPDYTAGLHVVCSLPVEQRMNGNYDTETCGVLSSTDLHNTECRRDMLLLEPIRIDQNGVTDGVTTLVLRN